MILKTLFHIAIQHSSNSIWYTGCFEIKDSTKIRKIILNSVSQLERCPRGGGGGGGGGGGAIFFAGGATKLSKLVLISENQTKKKRSSRQIGLLFCEFSVGPKKTKATVLKLTQGKGSLGGWGRNFCSGKRCPFLPPPLVAALPQLHIN